MHRFTSCICLLTMLVIGGCSEDEAESQKSLPPLTIQQPRAGALISSGANDIVFVLHHSHDYSHNEVVRQLALTRSIMIITVQL